MNSTFRSGRFAGLIGELTAVDAAGSPTSVTRRSIRTLRCAEPAGRQDRRPPRASCNPARRALRDHQRGPPARPRPPARSRRWRRARRPRRRGLLGRDAFRVPRQIDRTEVPCPELCCRSGHGRWIAGQSRRSSTARARCPARSAWW